MSNHNSPSLTRRQVLASGVGTALAAALFPGHAQVPVLSVFGHRVHQAAAITGGEGDVTAAWR